MRRISTNWFIIPPKIRLPLAAALVLAVAASAALAGIFTAQAQSSPPAVSNVEIVSSPASGTSYGVGEAIRVKITFDQDLLLQGVDDALRPQLKLSIGAIQNRTAHFIDHSPEDGGNNVLLFQYFVTANDRENYGISINDQLVNDRWVSPLAVPAGGRVYAFNDSRIDANLDLGDHAITQAYGHRVNATTPEPPANVQAVSVSNGIRLTWEQPGSIVPPQYVVWRGAVDAGDAVSWFWVFNSQTTYTDTADLVEGHRYEYRIKGYQGGSLWAPDISRASETVQVRYSPTQPTPTPAPTDTPMPTPTPAPTATPMPTLTPAPTAAPTLEPTATPAPGATATPAQTTPSVIAVAQNSVTIDWSAVVGAGGAFRVGPTANGFHLYRRAAGSVEYTSIAELSLSQTSYQDTGLQPGTEYTWRLYEDHPQHRHNLIGDVTYATLPAPTPTPTPAASPTPAPTPNPTPGLGGDPTESEVN